MVKVSRLGLIHMKNIQIYVFSCVCLSHVCPSVLCGKAFNAGLYAANFQPIFFIPIMLLGTTDFFPFCTSFGDLDCGWGSQCQHKAKPVCLNSLYIFQLSGMKAIQVEHFETTFEWDFIESKEVTAVLLTASKTEMLGHIQTLMNQLGSNLV